MTAREHFNTIVESVMPNFWKKVVAGFTPRFSEPVEKFSLMLFFPLDVDFTYYVDKVEILCSDMVEVPGIVLKDNFEENTGSWQPEVSRYPLKLLIKSLMEEKVTVRWRKTEWLAWSSDRCERNNGGRKKLRYRGMGVSETGENQQITLTMQRKYASDAETHYDTIAWQKTVPSGEWTKLTGSYTVKPGEKLKSLYFILNLKRLTRFLY